MAGEVGEAGPPTPGQATDSELDDPVGIAVDSSGNLYIADSGNDVIEKVTPAGQLSIIAGQVGEDGAPTPGPATQSAIDPADLAVDGAGDVYAADNSNNVVEKITPAGHLSIVAGEVGEGGAPTAGPATASDLSFEDCGGQVAVSSSGTLYIADCGNALVEEVTPSGQLQIIAGQLGQSGSPTSGPATSSELVDPTGIVLDGSGNVYVADANNAVVEELKPSG